MDAITSNLDLFWSGFLRSLNMLRVTSKALGDVDEATRCAVFLRECSQQAAEELGA